MVTLLPTSLHLPLAVGIGICAGLGLAVAHLSRAASYLSDAPEVCVNCHVMRAEYGSWQRSSHARDAVCNDCHVPHTNEIAHYAFKARDGLRHSSIFTLRWEPQVLELSRGAIPVVQGNCIRCHEDVVSEVLLQDDDPRVSGHEGTRLCWDCHRDVPHGRAHSLSTIPLVLNPTLPPVTEIRQEPTIGGRLPHPVKEPRHEP